MRNVCPCLLLLCLTAGAAADWNQWRGERRDGVDHDSPALSAVRADMVLKPAWVSEDIPSGGSGGWGSPVVAGECVYLYVHSRRQVRDPGKPRYPWLPPDKRGHLTPAEYEQYEKNRRDEDQARGGASEFHETLYCFDARTGAKRFATRRPSIYTRFVMSGTPAVVGGRVFVQAPGRVARCFDAATGEQLWETKLPGEFRDEFMMSSFAVADGAAAVLAGHLFALDVKTGDILWQGDKRDTRGSHTSAVVWEHEGKSYFIINVGGGETACIEPRTGRELWRVDSDAVNATPVIVTREGGDLLITYARSRRGGLRCYRLSIDQPEAAWSWHGASDLGSSPVVVGDYVYVQGEKRIACIGLADGQEKWQTLIIRRTPEYTSLVAADGKVLYALEGLLWFEATPDAFTPIIDARMDADGLVAGDEAHRKLLKLDELEAAEGEKKAEQVYRAKVGNHQPLRCVTPALTGGRLYVRRDKGIVCYDLTGQLGRAE